MSVSAFVPPQIAKEVRALAPAWAACLCVVGANAVIHDSRLVGLGFLAYGLGSIALGAQAMGHEYSSRTLGVLLAQPFDRRRIFLLKFVVLASMLITLTLLAGAVFLRPDEIVRPTVRPDIWRGSSTLLLAVPLGLFVAPFLTMLCRGPLAGMVFTVGAPGLLLIAGDLIGLQRYGLGGGALIDAFKLKVLWWGTLAGSAVAALASWRMFMRLEAIDGRGAELSLPDWLRIRPTREDTGTLTAVRKRHPAWLLLKKELRLQQMAFVVAGLYVLGWTSLALLQASVPDLPEIPLGALSMLYFALLAALIGSLASAEERQLGTIEWQMLLPVPAWQQWSIKVAAVLMLAIVLGIGLPAGLWYLHAPAHRLPVQAWREIAMILVVFTTGGLYISSLSGSGVKAVVLSLPAAVGTIVFIRAAMVVVRMIFRYLPSAPSAIVFPVSPRERFTIVAWIAFGLAAGLSALLLRFGFANHRSADRGRLWTQLACIASFLAGGVLVMTWIERSVLSR